MLYWTPKFVTQDGSFILWYSNNFSFSPFFSFFFLFPYFLPACNDGQLLAKVGQVSGCSGRQKMEPPPSSPLICPKSTKRNYSKHAERHKTLQFLLLLEQFFFPSFLSLSLSLSCRERGTARVLLGASSFPRFIGAPVITTAFNFCSLFCGLLFFLLFFLSFFLSFLFFNRELWHDDYGWSHGTIAREGVDGRARYDIMRPCHEPFLLCATLLARVVFRARNIRGFCLDGNARNWMSRSRGREPAALVRVFCAINRANEYIPSIGGWRVRGFGCELLTSAMITDGDEGWFLDRELNTTCLKFSLLS